MRKLILLLFLFSLCACSPVLHEFETDHLLVKLNDQGFITSFFDKNGQQEYLPDGLTAPLLSVRVSDSIYVPTSMSYDENTQMINLGFTGIDTEASIKLSSYPTHLKFELANIEHGDLIELIIWGPYPTTINKSIGETVGVVRGETFAMGLQALNPKTLGGYPWKENDCMPQIDIFENEDLTDLSEEGKRYVLYRVEAAKPDTFGSTLQAYCRNRDKDRFAENWGHEQYLIPAYDDGGVIGSKIALFACPVENTLDVIGEIEIAEGLPHPTIDGVWGKKAPGASAAYLILGFGEEDIGRAISYTKKAGLKYLYHSGPFETWGHFKLSNQFPSGIKGLKRCVDQAAEEGIFVGVHTLSNFITSNDPYVTPVPDQGLAKVGYVQLVENIDTKQIEIALSNPDIFLQIKNNNLKTVVIDQELITYKNISEKPPFRLHECERGAYGSVISNHSEGTQVGLLADHAYSVFLSDASLTKEMAINIAELFNQTGLRQISFDGLEGNRSTGMGNYGEILMASTWYEHLDDNIRKHFIADASRTSHYFWHIYSRMNWGEPWYAGFRESQTEYRFKNQAYFERNLMPGMLGWFLLTKTTSLEDIEWMLAKSAAYKAGYGFVCNYKNLEENALTDQILALIGRWEEARMKDIFDEQTRMILKDPKLEFHLEKTEDQQWILDQYAVEHYEYLTNQRQPGESEWSQFEFVNPFEKQRLQFTIAISYLMELKDPVLEINNTHTLKMPVHLKPGYRIHYSGGKHIDIFDLSWHLTERIPIDPSVLLVLTGVNKIKMKGKAIGNIPQHVKIELKTKQRLVYF